MATQTYRAHNVARGLALARGELIIRELRLFVISLKGVAMPPRARELKFGLDCFAAGDSIRGAAREAQEGWRRHLFSSISTNHNKKIMHDGRDL
jgi:hypothetical protein